MKQLDAPIIPSIYGISVIIGGILTFKNFNYINLIFTIFMFILTVEYLYASLIGKYRIIERVVSECALSETSQVLDLGTGHGAVLLAVARYLKVPGKVIGIDIWKQSDQANNSLVATQTNINQAQLTSVAEVHTADMRKLPFDDEQFDAIFACLSIHNIKPAQDRKQALLEAMRVLKSGGKLCIIDIEHVNEYKTFLTDSDCQSVTVRNAGIDGFYGALPTKILLAIKK